MINDKPKLPRLELCKKLEFSYRNLMYWQVAVSANGLQKPGAKAVESFVLDSLFADLGSLQHGNKRSKGSGGLHTKYKKQVSRRTLDALVKDARFEFNYRRLDNTYIVSWLKPGTVWAIDDTLLLKHNGCSIYLNNIQDLASCQKLSIFIDPFPEGKIVARNLKELFLAYGAPVFLKRDNGSNLNSKEVNDVLDEFKVIPINSPVATPTYNGGIEHSQKEIKQQAALESFMQQSQIDDVAIKLHVQNAIHSLNHKPRKKLNGRYSCEVFSERHKHKLNKRKRRDIYDEITQLAADILAAMPEEKKKDKENKKYKKNAANVAFRQAAKNFMLENKHIDINLRKRKGFKCNPIYKDVYTING